MIHHAWRGRWASISSGAAWATPSAPASAPDTPYCEVRTVMVTGMKVAASARTTTYGSSRCQSLGAPASNGVDGWDAWDSPWPSSRRLRRAALSRPSAGGGGPAEEVDMTGPA